MATNTYVALDKITVSGSPTSVTFTSIPATYTDLVVVISGARSSTNDIGVRLNGDTGTNYSRTILYGTGTTTGSATGGGSNQGQADYYGTVDTTLGGSVQILNFMNYSNTTTYKTFLVRSNNASLGVDALVNLWRSTAAINSIEFRPYTGSMTWTTGSTFELYGIRAEGVSPTTKATGGNIYSDSTYYYHVFPASGTFTPTQSITADMLVVAGGGGGGYYYGGGGGAGGLQTLLSQSLTAQAYTITVGAGGAALTATGTGNNGTNSQFGSLTASVGGGGGGGGGHSYDVGAAGGSGGGGSSGAAGGAATSGQGYAGGTDGHSAGGGGAGQAGQARQGGNGATSTFINTLGLATGAGEYISSTGNYYFAGGGGASSSVPPASYGGGGVGNSTSAAKAGKPNTGGGGGGDANGNGGSGIVIVRYAK